MDDGILSSLAGLAEEIVDADEETFDLFSQASSLPDLGMVDPKATDLELSVAGRDFTITQSPGILQSKREGGTTGAAVWQTSIRLANWLAHKNKKFAQLDLLNAHSNVLELGSGISGLVPCMLGPTVKSVVATDQPHLLKALQANIEANSIPEKQSNGKRSTNSTPSRRKPANNCNNIKAMPLDWEQDDIRSFLESNDMRDGIDIVIASDCVFNYALIEPLMETCADICRVRQECLDAGEGAGKPTVCLIAQQIRQPEVFEQWLATTLRYFRVWRVPDEMLSGDLKGGSGFVIHLAVLKV